MTACAKQTSLSGGERDTVPPQVVNFEPPLFTTHFDGHSFSLTFDEFFSVDNLNKQLVISPPLDFPPVYRIQGKTLKLTWKDTLLPNTTYQFNFGGGIVDLTEKNPTDELVYVFSTGSYIDSLTIRGSVSLAKDNTPLGGAAVMLYRGSADSLPRTTKPDYFTISKAEGQFNVRYLPEGDFKVFVLKEENPDYLYNGPPEIIGFLDHRLSSAIEDSTSQGHHIPTFIEKDTAQYIASTSHKDYGFYQVVFNQPAKDPIIRFKVPDTDLEAETISVLSPGRDTLKTWIDLSDNAWKEQDELLVVLNDDTGLVDTSFWYLEIDPKFRDKPSMKMQANAGGNKLDLNRDLSLKFNNPITEVDTSLIRLFCDSVELPLKQPLPSDTRLAYTFPYRPVPECSYALIVKAGAFKDIFGTYNDSATIFFSLREKEFYGSLTLLINDSLIATQPHPIVQLISATETVIRTDAVHSHSPLQYNQLTPGKYQLKIIFDRNNNNTWDSGRYNRKLQPEKVTIYSEVIEIRSNWDLEIEWTPAPPY